MKQTEMDKGRLALYVGDRGFSDEDKENMREEEYIGAIDSVTNAKDAYRRFEQLSHNVVVIDPSIPYSLHGTPNSEFSSGLVRAIHEINPDISVVIAGKDF